MVGLLHRSRTSTGAAAVLGATVGVTLVGVYLGAGLLIANWSVNEFVAHLSLSSVGYFLGMIALAVAVLGLPIAALLRYDVTAPFVILILVVLGWVTIGAVQGVLSVRTIFGLVLYSMLLSPLYLVLYVVLGGGEYVFRRQVNSQ